MNAIIESVADSIAGVFKELDYFEECDRASFAGRKREVTQVVARVCNQKCLVVYGRSGLGKTSLLLAGVFPQLRERGFLPIYVRTLESPLDDLRKAIAEKSKTTRPKSSMAEQLREIGISHVPVLVLDQFEEFFIRFGGEPGKRSDFIDGLTALIRDPACDFRLVFSLREEYLSALDGFQRELPDLFNEAYRLGPLSAFAAREAIVTPLISNRITYSETLITKLVDELARFDFDSARLQVTCAELCEFALSDSSKPRHLSMEDFSLFGKQLSEANASSGNAAGISPEPVLGLQRSNALLEGIFRRYLTRKIAEVESIAPTTARLILEMMITREKTKYAISVKELRDQEPGSVDEVSHVLAMLEAGKIIRHTRRSNTDWYELMHECLVPEIVEWLKADLSFKSYQSVRNLIHGAADPSGVGLSELTSESMDLIRTHRDRLRTSRQEAKFVLLAAISKARAEDIVYWADRYGKQDAHALVLHLLQHQRPLKVQTIMAAACFKDCSDDLVSELQCLALDVAQVRENRLVAGQVFALLASDPQVAAFGRRIKPLAIAPLERDVLIQLSEANRIDQVGNVLTLWRAQRLAARHCANEYLEEHSKSWRFPPWTVGLFAGLAWVPTGAVPVVVLALIYFFGDDKITSWTDAGVGFMLGEVIALGVAVILGPTLGMRIVRSAALGHVSQRKTWFHAAARSGVVLALLCVPLLFISYLILVDDFPVGWIFVAWIGSSLAAAAIRYLVSGVVRFAAAQAHPEAPAWRTMLLPPIAALIFLVVLPMAAMHLLEQLRHADVSRVTLEGAVLTLLVAQSVASLTATVSGITLLYTRPAPGPPPRDSFIKARRAALIFAPAAVVACLVGASYFFVNPAVSVLVAGVQHLDDQERSEHSLVIHPHFTHWPQTIRWRGRVADGPALVEVQYGQDFPDLNVQPLDEAKVMLGFSQLQFAHDGVAEVFGSNRGAEPADERHSINLVGVPIQRCAVGVARIGLPGSEERSIKYVCPMRWDSEREAWTLQVIGPVTTDRIVSLTLPWSPPSPRLGENYELRTTGDGTMSAELTANGLFVVRAGVSSDYPGFGLQLPQSGKMQFWLKRKAGGVAAERDAKSPPYIAFAVADSPRLLNR